MCLCAVSECRNEAVASVDHDNNSFTIPLCKEHLLPYIMNLTYEINYYEVN